MLTAREYATNIAWLLVILGVTLTYELVFWVTAAMVEWLRRSRRIENDKFQGRCAVSECNESRVRPLILKQLAFSSDALRVAADALPFSPQRVVLRAVADRLDATAVKYRRLLTVLNVILCCMLVLVAVDVWFMFRW